MTKLHILNGNMNYKHGVLANPCLLWFLSFVFAIIATGLNSCSEDDTSQIATTDLTITNVIISPSIDLVLGGDITIIGEGFASGDRIRLTSTSESDKEYLVYTSTVTSKKAIFSLPLNIVTGKYSITLVRGDKILLLGSFTLNIVTDDTSIPDVIGMTIKGVVSSEGKGVEGVVVSDGYEVTTTDADGIYYLSSLKKNKYVFIPVPGNYEVSSTNNLPMFFKRLAGGVSVEQRDFY